jgi:gas vesicle protein
MNNMAKDTAKKLAITTAIAGIAGYVAGILTAPKSGKETREDIKEATHKGVTEAEKQLKRLHTELTKLLEEVKTRGSSLNGAARKDLDNLVEVAKTSKEKARELLSALHEGNAEDKDLEKAIKDATKAIEHLRDYLAK